MVIHGCPWRRYGNSCPIYSRSFTQHSLQCPSLNNVVLYGQDTADAIGDYADQATKTMEGERREILTALEAIYKLEKNV